MKTLYALVVLLVLSSPALAQLADRPMDRPENNLMLAAEGKATSFNDDWGVMTGLSAEWMSNYNYSVGLAGYIQTSELFDSEMIATAEGPQSGRLEGFYGGVTTGYSIQPANRVRVGVNNLFGVGQMRLMEGHRADETDGTVDKSTMLLLEPGLQATVALSRFLNLGAGASWRFVVDSDLQGFDNEDLSGPAARLSLSVGRSLR